MGADRFNTDKLKWSLVDFKSLEDMVRVLEFGAKKYDTDNWKKGLPTKEIVESMLRHIYAYLDGEDLDPESGLPHIGHIQCNALFLSYMSKNKPEFDNRGSKTIPYEYEIFNDGNKVIDILKWKVIDGKYKPVHRRTCFKKETPENFLTPEYLSKREREQNLKKDC